MRFMVPLLAASALSLSACHRNDTPGESASSAAADAQIDAAGHDLGKAAAHAAAGLKAAGDVLVAHGKDALADAASDVGTAASEASTKIRKADTKRPPEE